MRTKEEECVKRDTRAIKKRVKVFQLKRREKSW